MQITNLMKNCKIFDVYMYIFKKLCLLELPKAVRNPLGPSTELEIITTLTPIWCNISMHSIASTSLVIVFPVRSLKNKFG